MMSSKQTYIIELLSTVPLLHVVSGTVVLFLLCRYLYLVLTNPLNTVPGPLSARFTNLPLKFAVITGKRIHHVHRLHERYGPLVRIAPTEVAVADVDALKQIHGSGAGFYKSPWYKDMVAAERDGVFVMNGQAHANRRRLLSRPFSKTHLRQHWEDIVRERVLLAVSQIINESSAGAVDVMKWWTFLASDVSTHLMFGQSFSTLEQGKVSEYIRRLSLAMMGSGIGYELPLLRWIGRRLPFTIFQELWATNDYLADYGKLAVANMKASGGSTNIFANMMAEAEKGERLDDLDVQVEAQNLIIAGTDTTSITLTYLVWAVLSRPELRQQIEDEVKQLPDEFHDSDVEKLVFLNAVIEETLRLYGAAPGGLPRTVPSGGTVIGEIFIPEGTTVTTQAYTYHRDASLFPDPLEFRPERWTSSGKEGKYGISQAGRAGYSPFGSGPRTCLGVHLAYMELRLAAAEFFRRCAGAKLAPSATPESMEMENHFLIAPVGHKCEILLS